VNAEKGFIIMIDGKYRMGREWMVNVEMGEREW